MKRIVVLALRATEGEHPRVFTTTPQERNGM